MSKARILADLISDSQITASEITGLELNSIQEGDTVVQVSDTGSGGKVVVRVDGADNAEFNANGMVIPKGTTAQRDPAAVVGSLRYNTTTGFFETFTSSGWGAVATPPSITNVTPSNFSGEAGSTFTVNGAFFDANTTAVLKGADGTEYAAATVTFVNSTQITLTNATNLPVSNEPFRVSITNGAGLSAESVQGIDAGSVPAFTTAAGSLASATWTDPISVTVNATDAENTISGYAVTEGNLPTGITLDGTTGAITGTSTAQATTTYTFTIGATDSAGNTNTRQFSIQIVNAAPVWSSPAEGSTQEINVNTAGSITLAATDPEGESVSYTSGTLPTGLSLSGNVISGTPTVQANTSVAVTASDGFASSVRNFFINVTVPPIYTTAIQRFIARSANGGIVNEGTIGDGTLSARSEGWGTNGSTTISNQGTPGEGYFNGNHTTNNMTVNQSGSYTVSYWVFGNSDASGYWMFFAGDNNMHMYYGGTDPRIGDSSHPVYGNASYTSPHLNLPNVTQTFVPNVWQHWTWVVTVSGGQATYKVYKNGTIAAYSNSGNTYSGPNTAHHYYGARNSGQNCDVSLNKVSYWDSALTQSQVSTLYAQGG